MQNQDTSQSPSKTIIYKTSIKSSNSELKNKLNSKLQKKTIPHLINLLSAKLAYIKNQTTKYVCEICSIIKRFIAKKSQDIKEKMQLPDEEKIIP